MSGTTESALFGNTSNPWKHGYSAGGSTGGGHGGGDGRHRADRARLGHRRLDPHPGELVRRRRPQALARPRVLRPGVDEGGWGLAQNFVQTKTVRDAAAMLDCVAMPQPGDPFMIPGRRSPMPSLASRRRGSSIGIVLDRAGRLAGRSRGGPRGRGLRQGCSPAWATAVERASVDFGGRALVRCLRRLVLRLRPAARRLCQAQRPQGRPRHARAGDPRGLRGGHGSRRRSFIGACSAANMARRKLGAFFAKHDIWLSPTTSRVAEPWGTTTSARAGVASTT